MSGQKCAASEATTQKNTENSYSGRLDVDEIDGMMKLPEEMVEIIASYLSAQDLTHCSAVSVGWRERFNRDLYWERFSDKRLIEYFNSSNPVIDFKFDAPVVPGSKLSPVCHWRWCYMREIHMWSSWRRNRTSEFTMTDFYMITIQNTLMLWNVIKLKKGRSVTSDKHILKELF